MTKWCVLCGGDYNATVLECVDCNVPLADRKPLQVDEVVAEGEEQLVYDFSDIDNMQRVKVDEIFWENGIAHAWVEANLIVRPDDEERADELLEEADEGDFLDRDVEQISYELDEWDDTHRQRLVEALEGAGIEHAWDASGELVVLADDEERVDDIIEVLEDEWDGHDLTIDDIEAAAREDEEAVYGAEDADVEDADVEDADVEDADVEDADVEDDDDEDADREEGEGDGDGDEAEGDDEPEAEAGDDELQDEDEDDYEDEDEDEDGEDGGDGHGRERQRSKVRGHVDEVPAGELLSDVFVAADRLMRDPSDAAGVLGYVEAAEVVEGLGLPFGFSPAVWRDMQHRILELRESLTGDVDDDVILEQATSVRNQLRAYV